MKSWIMRFWEVLASILHKMKVERGPKEGGGDFLVDTTKIDWGMFEKPRQDPGQEELRRLILDAFGRLDQYPDQFCIKVPKRTWRLDTQSIAGLKAEATSRGGHMADWVELALQWAYRLSEGTSWERICNEPSRHKSCWVVIWKDGIYVSLGLHCEIDIDDDYPRETNLVNYATTLVVCPV